MMQKEQWQGFEGRLWKEEINIRDFIQNNYTPYEGDASFLADPTEATNQLWGKLQELQKEERAKGGAGLIMTGAMFLSEKTAQGGPTLNLYSTRAIPKATVMVERVHRWGAKICLQLSCGTGRNGMPDIGERVPISSSPNPAFYNPEMICRPLEVSEIKDIMK